MENFQPTVAEPGERNWQITEGILINEVFLQLIQPDVIDMQIGRFGQPHACVRYQGNQPTHVIIMLHP